MRGAIQSGRFHAIALGAAACFSFWQGGAARADDASSWREIETKYIFGFTTGSGIGLEGEKEFTVDSIGRFGKRDGHYAATETKYEFEFTPTQFIQIEFGALGSTHNIGGMTDLDDRRQVALSGMFAELRYLAIERTSSNPLAVTLAFEPTARRIDETGGESMFYNGGFYKDRLVKQPGGWRISERVDLGTWIPAPLPARLNPPPAWYGTMNHHQPRLPE